MKLTQLPLVIVLATGLIISIPLSWAQDAQDPRTISPEAVMVDTFLARPAGLVATVAGAAIFIVALPFSLATDNTDHVAEKLIRTPARYTFQRPMGEGMFNERWLGCQRQPSVECPREYAR